MLNDLATENVSHSAWSKMGNKKNKMCGNKCNLDPVGPSIIPENEGFISIN